MYSIVMQGNILRAQRYLSYRPQSRWSGLCGGVKPHSVSIQLFDVADQQIEFGVMITKNFAQSMCCVSPLVELV